MRNAPTHLKHKPVYEIDDYDKIDGGYKNSTDVHALSLGCAQWDDTKSVPSVKVWRKPNGKWSRQSEETTLTRALDMATLVIKVLDHYYHNKALGTIKSTPFGSVAVNDSSYLSRGKYEAKIRNFVSNPVNQEDINTHLLLLKEALDSYYDI